MHSHFRARKPLLICDLVTRICRAKSFPPPDRAETARHSRLFGEKCCVLFEIYFNWPWEGRPSGTKENRRVFGILIFCRSLTVVWKDCLVSGISEDFLCAPKEGCWKVEVSCATLQASIMRAPFIISMTMREVCHLWCGFKLKNRTTSEQNFKKYHFVVYFCFPLQIFLGF